MIYGDNGGRFPHCHTYLLIEGDEMIIIDPQCGKYFLEKGLRTMDKSWNDISYIINTHFHADHTASNAFIKKQNPDLQILIHKDDAKGIQSSEEYFRRYGLTGEAKTHYKSIFKSLGYEQLTPDITFEEGDIIPGDFEVIHTPGHTPGHCCFYKSGVLISGDIDLLGRPWVSNITSSVNDFHKSINKLLNMNIKILLPSHRQPVFEIEIIYSKLKSYKKKILETSKKILDLIDGDLSFEEILSRRNHGKDKAIWSQNPLIPLFRRYDTLNYLRYLEQMGKLKQAKKDNIIYWSKK